MHIAIRSLLTPVVEYLNYLINKLELRQGNTSSKNKNTKNSPKVTANISDFIYSAITIVVKLINGRKSHCVFTGSRIPLEG